MLRLEYRSDEAVLARDLYDRCLPLSNRFDRAVGFFAGSVFAASPDAFKTFFLNRGKMRVVCCPVLDRVDIDSIYRGHRDRPQLIRVPQLQIFDEGRRDVLAHRGKLLSWLVASGQLQIRVAVRTGASARHIYHEKVGIFSDGDGNAIAFAGSANESIGGVEGNFECVDVFRSWEPTERKRLDQKVSGFKRLWANDTDGLEVLSFPEAAVRGLLKIRPDKPDNANAVMPDDPPPETQPAGVLAGIEETLLVPSDIQLKEHQKAAIRKWFERSGRGILEMATGSGKTITALAAATKLYESIGGPIFILIVCPFIHLCAQWIEEAGRFGLDPLLCAIDRSAWLESLSTRLYNLGSGVRRIASAVVTNSTFASPAFQSVLSRIPARSLIVADEVHNLGAADLRRHLPEGFRHRLGLSATPERLYDPSGTQAIRSFFGDVVYKYTLAEALHDGVLCPYRYFPVRVPLADEEMDEYIDLTRRIAQAMSGNDDEGGGLLESLLIRRSRLIATAKNKIPALISKLSPLKETTHNLVYCGDGTVESPVDASVTRQIDEVVRAMGRDLGMTVSRYIADTPLTRRHLLRRRFAEGEVQGLVAIRCLDEGVDIPETRRAFILASSTNPRQFIQRRGRVLRRAPGKDFAEIFDFIVEPPGDLMVPANPLYRTVKRLFERELGRIFEFASLALNGPEALGSLLTIRDQLGLLDFGAN